MDGPWTHRFVGDGMEMQVAGAFSDDETASFALSKLDLPAMVELDGYVGGGATAIEVEGADWVDKDDSLLKAQVAVQVMITFNGGVYRDTGFAPLTDVRVTSVEKIT